MNKPTPIGASEVPKPSIAELTRAFIGALPLSVQTYSLTIGAVFDGFVRPLLRENEELRCRLEKAESDTQRAEDAIADRDAAIVERDSLRAEVERLKLQLAAVGEFAVTDWDDKTVGIVDEALKGKDPVRYRDRLRELFIEMPSELTHLRERVKELERVLNELNVAGGVTLIAQERLRQINKEGWTAEHDDQHKMGELSEAACCYATVASAEVRGSSAEEWPADMFNGHNDSVLTWPWLSDWWKPSNDPVRNLTKAGALIAAEIDRLQRKAIADLKGGVK